MLGNQRFTQSHAHRGLSEKSDKPEMIRHYFCFATDHDDLILQSSLAYVRGMIMNYSRGWCLHELLSRLILVFCSHISCPIVESYLHKLQLYISEILELIRTSRFSNLPKIRLSFI